MCRQPRTEDTESYLTAILEPACDVQDSKAGWLFAVSVTCSE